jgi:hypothetical protein
MRYDNGTGDENRFENERHAHLEQMDLDFAGERPIEILPTYIDDKGTKWQLPHEDANGWARLCFDAMQDGKMMTSTVKQPLLYQVARGGRWVVSEWLHITFYVWVESGCYHVMENGKNHSNRYTRPAMMTYALFVSVVGLGHDFRNVILE